jgi:hypothetical protein
VRPAVIVLLPIAAFAAWQFVATGSGWWMAASYACLAFAGAAMIEINAERECWDE